QQLNALNELARQTHLPVAALRRALASGAQRSAHSLLAAVTNGSAQATTIEAPVSEVVEKTDAQRAITGKFVTLESTPPSTPARSEIRESQPSLIAVPPEANQDKSQMTIEALRARPDMTDEALAEFLSLKRPASARFWRLKAIEILNSPNRDTGPTAAVQSNWAVPTTIGATNGTSSKR